MIDFFKRNSENKKSPELSAEEERYQVVLNFSKLLSDVRDYSQLICLVEASLKPLIGYRDFTIFLLDADRSEMCRLSAEANPVLPQSAFVESIAITAVPFYGMVNNDYQPSGNKTALNFKKLTEAQAIHPFLRHSAGIDQSSGQLFNLFDGRDIIGNCIFLFDLDSGLSGEMPVVLPLIIQQLSTAIVNLKSTKQIEKNKREREILESINTDIAFNKDRFSLLKSINPKMRLLMNYSHQFVKAINDDQLTVTGLLGDTESRARFHPRYGHMVTAKFVISDQVFNKVLLSNDPVIFDLEEMSAKGTMPEYMSINFDCGIKKMVMLSLRVGARIIGIWVLCLVENQEMTHYQLELLKGISHQLSVAAENIKAGDVLQQKNRERDFMSRISSDITEIRERKDLDKLFNRTLKEELRFQQAVVMIKNDDLSYHEFLYTPEMYGADPGHDVDFSGTLYSVSDPVFQRLSRNAGAVVFFMSELMDKENVPDYLKPEYAAGVKVKIGIKLVRDKTEVGAVFFNFPEGSVPSVQELELYDNISYQLSTAIFNVLLNEESIRREKERELLFSLSTEMAAVRNSSQLIQIITDKLKIFFGFSYLAIGTLNADPDYFDVLEFDPDSIAKKHPGYQKLISSVFPVKDGIIDAILDAPSPVAFDLMQLADAHQLPVYLKISQDCGINQVIGVRFTKEYAAFGLLLLFFESKLKLTRGKASMLRGLANQIAVAVANIKANMKLQRKAEEEGKLLQFGTALAVAKNFSVLHNVLNQQLKALFGIGPVLLVMLSEDKLSFKGSSDFPGLMMPLDISGFRIILESKGVVKLHSGDFSSADQEILVGSGIQTGSESMSGSLITIGQQPVGFIAFLHQEADVLIGQEKFFESICSQIAVVAANLDSRLRIESQLAEIETYKRQLEEEKIYLTEEIETIHNYTEIIGESTALKDTFRLVSQVSPTDSTVLILGETGTGKELIARAIHNNSPRKHKLMVKVNCAALPANLIESELFGHEKGSFTGATERRFGKFELANNGTLFLDEIGEMPVDLQVKLLRALQEKEIERVGGKETIKVDVRIIAATNRNLELEISEGRFRSDLFYRLNIFPISLPPLRDRKQDIESLAMHFVRQFNKNCGKNINSISSKAIVELMNYDWPGNIRELEHLIERSVLLTSGTVLKDVLLPSATEQLVFKAQLEEFSLKTIDENEKDYILKILKYCNGRIAGEGGAAQILGVPPTTLNSKIKRLGIKREHTL